MDSQAGYARKNEAHLCLRYNLLLMSPGRTLKTLVGGNEFEKESRVAYPCAHEAIQVPTTIDLISIIFALTAVVGLLGGLLNRSQGSKPKGIGTQFIRYTTIVVALPIAATLVLQDMPTEAIVTIVLGALGYTFTGAGAKS